MKSFDDMAAVIMLLQGKARTRPELIKLMGWSAGRHSVRRVDSRLRALIGEGLVKEIEPVRGVNCRGGTTRDTRCFEWVG